MGATPGSPLQADGHQRVSLIGDGHVLVARMLLAPSLLAPSADGGTAGDVFLSDTQDDFYTLSWSLLAGSPTAQLTHRYLLNGSIQLDHLPIRSAVDDQGVSLEVNATDVSALPARFEWTASILQYPSAAQSGGGYEETESTCPQDSSPTGPTPSNAQVYPQGPLPTASSSNSTTTSVVGSGSTGAVLLEGGGLGVVTFGSDSGQAVSDLTSYLGAPSSQSAESCGDATYEDYFWNDLELVFDSADTLVGYRYGASIGYQTGVYFGPNPSPSLSTSDGIGLGASPTQIRSTYPGVRTSYPSADSSNPADMTATVGGQALVFIMKPGSVPGQSGPVIEVKAGELCGDY